MRKYIIICDKCKKQVADDGVTSFKIGEGIDICNGCKEVFDIWLKVRLEEWCEGKPLSSAGTDEKPKKRNIKGVGKKPVDVDWDKACALRKAGWPYAKIADELYVSPATVYRKLYLDGYYSQYLEGVRMGGNNDEGND